MVTLSPQVISVNLVSVSQQFLQYLCIPTSLVYFLFKWMDIGLLVGGLDALVVLQFPFSCKLGLSISQCYIRFEDWLKSKIWERIIVFFIVPAALYLHTIHNLLFWLYRLRNSIFGCLRDILILVTIFISLHTSVSTGCHSDLAVLIDYASPPEPNMFRFYHPLLLSGSQCL